MVNDIKGKEALAGMHLRQKCLIIVSLIGLVAVAIFAKRYETKTGSEHHLIPSTADVGSKATTTSVPKSSLPKLVDLGSDKCIPCRMMIPILQKMKSEYAGQLDVVLIDVLADKRACDAYGVSIIPTQIFYDDTGKELFRHQGFFATQDILAKWENLGWKFRKGGIKNPPGMTSPSVTSGN